jgi:hypothetical protein
MPSGADHAPLQKRQFANATTQGNLMPTKSLGKFVKLTTDKTGKTKLSRVHAYDASKKRRIAKSKKVRVKR